MPHSIKASSHDAVSLRALIAEGVRQNPVVFVSDPVMLARLADPAADVAFDALGFDSLARMELCIHIQLEAGLDVTEAELLDHPSVATLAAHLAARG
jgi:acyl carrier protein